MVPVGDYQIGVQPFARLVDLPSASGAAAGPARGRQPIPAIWQHAYIKAIRIGDRDILNTDLVVEGQPLDLLEIVIGLSGASLEGRVLNANQEPVANAPLVLVPGATPPHRLDRYRSASTNLKSQPLRTSLGHPLTTFWPTTI